jgi:hypothetical protein
MVYDDNLIKSHIKLKDFYTFIYDLFNDPVSNSDEVSSNDRIINE